MIIGHSLLSRDLPLGEALPAIGKQFGHADIEPMANFGQTARDTVHETVERIPGSIAAAIL